ncbi:MAG: carbohydrate-binding protein, partial [Pedobacter sp.]
YVFRLSVTDDKGAANADELTVTVNAAITIPNQAPTVNTGANTSITLPTNSTSLIGAAIDADGTIASYSWSRLSGPNTFTIVSAGAPSTSVTGLIEGVYVFRLTVTDNSGGTKTDDITITQNPAQYIPGKVEAEFYTNQSGVAIEETGDAGGGYNVGYIEGGDWMDYLPTVATTGSYNVTFRVACPNGGGQFQLLSGGNLLTTINIPATGSFQNWISIPATVSLNAGAQPIRIYAVTGQWNINWMDFTLNAPVNQPPVADAGPNQLVLTPASTATLNGTATDPDGSIARYVWTFEGGPVTPIINSAGTPSTGITGLTQTGTYIFKLTVTDNGGLVANSSTAVIVSNSSSASSFYRPITIDHNRVVNTAQSNFPVLFSGTFPYLKTVAYGGKVYSSSGHDIMFTTDVSGVNKLSWEIEKYVPSTGEIVAWIKTDVSPVTDKVIYMHYGNNSISSFQSSAINAWNAAYAGVYHLSNNTGALSARDATVNSNNGSVTGATAVSAQIDGGANLTGSSQYINAGNNPSLGITGNVTLQAWLNPTDYANYNGIIGKTTNQMPRPYDFYLNQGNGRA